MRGYDTCNRWHEAADFRVSLYGLLTRPADNFGTGFPELKQSIASRNNLARHVGKLYYLPQPSVIGILLSLSALFLAGPRG